jgi:hypothetical protein
MPRKSSELPGRRLHPGRFRVTDEAKSRAQDAVALICEGRKGRSAGFLSTLGWNLYGWFSGRAPTHVPWHFIHHGPLQLLVMRQLGTQDPYKKYLLVT